MSFNIKQFLSVLFCCLPSLCFGIGLDTKIAWEPWAVNGAVMMFCMPDLGETKHLRSGGGNGLLGDYKRDLGTVGVISELVVDNETAIITTENVKLMPKCAAFIDSYIAKTEKNNKISLNEIISICLETIEDKLICENIVLSLVNLTENKKVLKNYNPKQMEQKIKDSVKADRTICSKDKKFCTTYSLFNERKGWSLDGVEGDAIYEKENNKIIGMCAGFDYKEVAMLPFVESSFRCLTTDSAYLLYEFGIKDLTDNFIELTYTDWGEMTDVSKKYLERVKPLIQKLDNCIANKKVNADTSWALDAMYKQGRIGLAFVSCERHNYQPNQEDKVMVCKAEILKKLYKDSQKCLQDISFDAAERNLEQYKSMLENCFMSVRTFQYQALTLLSECEN